MLLIELQDGRPGIVALPPNGSIQSVTNGRRWLEISQPPDAELERWVVDWETGEITVAPMVVPDWENFNTTILFDPDWQATATAVRAINSELIPALYVALGQVGSGQSQSFRQLFEAVCSLAAVAQAQRESWATMAEGFHLPTEFVSIVRGVGNG